MSVFVLNMTTMIGLGVGIDYSLLVVTRFREELARGARRQIAAVNTLATAGAAVITSGLTVVVGFGALLLTPLIETRSVGHRRAHRRGGGGAALDHPAPRPARRCSAARSTGRAGWRAGSPGTTRRRCGRSGPAR